MLKIFRVLSLILPMSLYGQTGPGGVGSASSNIIWVRASDIAGTDGAEITGWPDQSGNTNNLQVNGSNRPIYVASELNGQAIVRFGGHNNDRVFLQNMPDWPSNAITTFVVQKNVDAGDATLSYAVDGGSNNEYFQINSNSLTVSIDGTTRNTGESFNDNSWHINAVTWTSSGGAFSYYKDGTIGNLGFFQSGATMQTMGTFVIGAEQDSENGGYVAAEDYDGDIAEVIIFNTNLSNAERIIVENYLSSRYGLTISSDRYAFDNSYGNDLAGIGMAFGGGNTSARSAGLLQVSAASGLDNNEYLFFGHDNGGTTFSTAEKPADIEGVQRIEREWIFDETGDVGTVTVTIDATSLPLPVGYTDYYLLVDNNSDFSSGASTYLLTNTSGNEYEATGVQVGDGTYMTIAAVQPVIQFSELNSNDFESGTATIQVRLNLPVSSDIDVPFSANVLSTADGGGTDYSFATSSPVTITAGSTTTDIIVNINNEGSPEFDETIILDLGTPSLGQLGMLSQHTHVVHDDDETTTIQFTSTTGNGAEGTSPAVLPLTLSAVQGGDVTVDYSATGGTATGGGVDYFNSSGTATITAGNVTGSFTIDINQDVLNEANETIVIELSNPSAGVNLGANKSFTYTINDDETSPEVQFTTTSGSFTESTSQPSIQVELSAVSGQDVTVNFTALGLSALEGTDFLLADGVLTIPAGSTVGVIEPLIYDDDDIEGAEDFSITISTPSNASLGANTTFTATIGDNDVSDIGFEGPGGVGDASSNVAWLEAESIAGTNGLEIPNWPDNSGNGNNFIVNGSNQPIYVEDEVNGQPVVRFGGHNNDRVYNLNMPDFPQTELTTFLVLKNTDASEALISYAADTDSDNEFLIWGSQTTRPYVNGTNAGDQGVVFNDNAWHIQMVTWTSSGGNLSVYKDGALGSTDVVASGGLLDRDGTLVLGAEQDSENGGYDAGADYDGDMAEFILYDRVINAAQREIIHNYLGTKYAIGIANDYYAFDNSNGVDLIGIGQSGGDQHLTASDDVITIGSAASIDADGDFVFVGHDGGDIGSWTTTDAPSAGTNIQRVAREWRIDNSGTPGSISISFDASQLPALPSEYTKYYLLVDNDGAFNENADLYPLTQISGGEYSSSGLSLTDGDFLTVAVVRPTISFAAASSQIFESGGPASIEVALNFAGDEDLTVDYAINGSSTATADDDYVFSGGTLTIPAGNVSAQLSITLTDDTAPETDETLILDLSNPSSSAQLGDVTQHTLTINDTDVTNKIQFALAASNGAESVTPASFTIQVDNPDGTDMTVDYSVTAGTATGGGVDYFNSSGTATILGNNSDTQTTIAIDINEDVIDEANETFTITLTNPSANVNLGTNVTHVYTINDNDASPTVGFSSTVASGSEQISPGSIAVSLSAVSGQDVAVNYAAVGISAIEGTDFLLDDGTLTIPAGSTVGFIQPVLYDDPEVEGSEDFTVTLSSPSGATLGTNTSLTFNIGDNDSDGIGSTGPGGVGDETSNVVWLESENITGTDGIEIPNWPDNSGNANNFAVNGANQPIFVEDVVNGQPVVRFGGHNNDRVFNLNMPDFPSTELSAILVYRTLDASDAQISYAAATGSDNEFLILNSSNVTPLVAGNSAGNQGVAFNDNLWHIQTVTWTNAGGNLAIYKDGTQAATTTISNGETLEPDGTLVLGAEQDSENGGYDAGADYDGDMSEFILFDRVLNAAQRVVVENYLGAKYAIAIANDFYAFNNAKGHDVIGIGQNAGAQHQEASDRVVSISSASSIDADGEFIFVGHDGRDIATWTTDEVAGDNIYRLQREWQYDETGTVGVFSLRIDASALPTAPSSEYNRYYLLSDADGNFNAGATSHLMTNVGGDTYEISGLDLSDGDHFTIAIVRPAVSFELASSALFESGGPALVSVNLNYALDEVVTVDYAVNGSSTAGSGSDYVLADGTVTFPAGITTVAISAPLTDDTTPESDETIILDLSSPTNAQLGTTTQHTVTIHDTDIANKIQFQSTASNGDESVTPVSLTIEVNSADVTDMTVDWEITGGTATGGGIDYLSTSGTATILGNGADTQATISIDINEDVLDEVDETLIITLSNPSANVNLGTNIEHVYTINDNDAEPIIQFQSTASAGNEGSSPANVEVALDAISGRDVTINYTITGGTATNGNVDFNLANGTLTIPAGDAQGFIRPTIVDDDLVEGAETISFSIAGPSGATLGGTTTNTLTLTDNDNDGIIGPGGVGDETTNILWLRADDITGVSDGADIDGWVDASGNANHMNDNNSNVPAFEENEINGLPVVRFGDSNNDRVFLQNMNDFPSNAITTVTVFRTSETNGTTWSYATADQNNSYFQDQQQSARFAIDGTITTPNVVFNDGSWHVDVRTWTSDGGNYAIRKDGSQLATGNVENGGTIEAGGTLVLGAEQDSPNGGYDAAQDFDGELAEAILYNYVLNAAELAIVENYLAAKYNGEFAISNSYFAFGSNFGHDVVGIGQQSGDQHLAAQSGGNFTISTAAGLDADGDFLMIGHNDDDLTAWSTTEVPNGGTNIQRIAREWIMDVSGDISSFSVTVDVSGFPATPAGYDTYYLLVDTDGDFSTAPIYYPMESLGASQYETGNVAVVDGGFMTIAVVRSEIQFNAATSQEFEPDGPAVIPVELNFQLNEDATVDYAITGTATGGGTDYTLVDGTVTITAGNTSANINIPLTNDVILESSETIVLTLSNPSTGLNLGATDVHTFSILDDDNTRRISFDAGASTAPESVSPITLTLELSSTDMSDPVDPVNPTSADYVVTGTATGGGIDYVLADGTATIDPNTSSTTIDIVINQDGLYELDETIILTLSNPVNANLAATNTVYTNTIQDDDTQPSISFASAASSGSEGSTPANIEVQLSTLAGADVTVDYAVVDGSAVNGNVDYNIADGTLTIPAGANSGFIQPVIVDDSETESGEDFTITLSNAVGADLTGQITVTTFTIADNDNDGITGPGGVGDENTITVWLKADNITGITDGADISAGWPDASGGGRNMTVGGGNRPNWIDNEINGLPVVRYSNNNDRVVLSNTNFFPSTAITTITLLKTAEDNGTTYSYATAAQQNEYFQDRQQSGRFAVAGNIEDPTPDVVFNDGQWHIDVHSWQSSDGAYEIHKDGALGASGTHATGSTMAAGGSLVIGAEQDSQEGGYDAAQDFDGDLAEMVIYNLVLNDAQRIIVENYLAAKYNGEFSIANDRYTFKASHGHDVAGIGRASAGNEHPAAQSATTLTVSNPSGLDGTNEYLIFGHDNASMAAWTTVEAPNSGTNIQRIEREWIFDRTNNVGTVTVTVDTSLFAARPNNYNDFLLLVDADGDFSSGATEYVMSALSGPEFSVDNIDIPDGSYITIATLRRLVQFTTSASSIFEPDGPASFEVSLNFEASTTATVDYAVTGGSATDGDDYTMASGTLTFNPGNLTQDLFVTLLNDSDIESSETVSITLSNPSPGLALGSDITHTLTINDDDASRRVEVVGSSSSGDESVTPIVITFQLENAGQIDSDNATSVNYTVTGTAVGGGEDYTLANGTATIAAGFENITRSLVIIDDAISEGSETIIVTISNPINANLSPTVNTFTYTVTDNDPEPTVSFSSAASNGSEAVSPGSIEVALSAVSGQDVSVNYTVADGTASGAGVDHNLLAGTLVIPAGNASGSIQPPITDDTETEPGETFTVTLTGATGATVAAPTSHTYTILDNDTDGVVGPGGVGDDDILVIWLDADDITGVADGAVLDTWTDESGNGNDLARANNPTYETNVVNGRPVVRFDNSNERFSRTSVSDFPTDAITTVTVLNTSETNGTTYSYATAVESNEYFQDRQQSGRFAIAGSIEDPDPDVVLNDGVWHIGIHTWRSSDGEYEIYKNGSLDGSGTHATGVTMSAGGTLVLGAEQDSPGGGFDAAQDFDGDIAEAMIYNRVLNDAQRILVENYLGAKYGIAVTNERYTHDATYGFDVAGVGQEDVTNFHAGASAGIIAISDPQSLENGDYMLYGHDNAGFADWTTDTNVPNVSTQRIPQEWVFEETGDIGHFTLTIDISGLPATTAGFDSYALLLDDDGDFTSGATYVALSNVSGNLYEALNVSMTGTTYLAIAAVEYITNGSGDFNTAGNWFAGVVPGGGQTAVITDGDAMVLTGDITVGSLVIGTGASLDLDGFMLTLDDGCISGPGSIDVSDPGSTISYAATTDQCVTAGTYHHLRLEGSGTKSLTGAITVDGDLSIADAAVTLDVTASNYQIDLSGSWDNSGTFNPRNGSVQFVGTSDQTLSSSAASSFHTLVLNITGGDLLLGASVDVGNTLTLNNGDLVLGTNDLILAATSTIAGGTANSYIQADNTGLIEQAVAAPGTFAFPMGDNDEYSPFTFILNSGTLSSAAVFLNLRDLIHPQVTDVAISRYWTMTQTGISGAIDYDVNFTYTDTDILRSNEGDFEGAKFSSGATTVTGTTNAATNTVTMMALSTFSDYTATGAGDLLPIDLLEFKARIQDQTVVLDWSTASETGNDYFTIERSYDWEHFEALGTLAGAGDSEQLLQYRFIDEEPLPGVSYYRLKQTDFDGEFTYSNLVMVEYEVDNALDTEFTIYPNPAPISEGVQVFVSGLAPGTRVEVKMVAMDGRETRSASGAANAAGHFDKRIDFPPNAVGGTYIVYFLYDSKRYYERVIVR